MLLKDCIQKQYKSFIILKTHKENLDVVLWEKLKTGDLNALGKLYDLYIDVLISNGMYISNDKEYVMDCIHDLFIDLYKYRGKITKTDNVKYYLLKSLKRKINRKYKPKTTFITNEYQFEINSQDIYSEPHEEKIITSENSSEISFKLKKAIDFLPKRQQKGIFLRFSENRPYEEIAEIMNVSVQTSRTIIYRGIKNLRQHLALFFIFSIIKNTFF